MENLYKYLGHKFTYSWDNTTEYLEFQKCYITYLRKLLKLNKWEILKVNKNHFEFSMFIKTQKCLIYISINDVRFYQDDWFNKILVRTVSSENDYIGNQNYYCKLTDLVEKIKNIIKE